MNLLLPGRTEAGRTRGTTLSRHEKKAHIVWRSEQDPCIKGQGFADEVPSVQDVDGRHDRRRMLGMQ